MAERGILTPPQPIDFRACPLWREFRYLQSYLGRSAPQSTRSADSNIPRFRPNCRRPNRVSQKRAGLSCSCPISADCATAWSRGTCSQQNRRASSIGCRKSGSPYSIRSRSCCTGARTTNARSTLRASVRRGLLSARSDVGESLCRATALSLYALGFRRPVCLHDVTWRNAKSFAELRSKVASARDSMIKQDASDGV